MTYEDAGVTGSSVTPTINTTMGNSNLDDTLDDRASTTRTITPVTLPYDFLRVT